MVHSRDDNDAIIMQYVCKVLLAHFLNDKLNNVYIMEQVNFIATSLFCFAG